MSSEDHHYVAGYSVEDDPYSLPSGVLKSVEKFEVPRVEQREHEVKARRRANGILKLASAFVAQAWHNIPTASLKTCLSAAVGG